MGAGTSTNGVLCVDGVTLDVEHSQVTGPTGAYHLTPLECRLLQILMLHPSQVISRSRLMKEVWGTDYVDDIRTLHVHICWLRRKVEEKLPAPEDVAAIIQQAEKQPNWDHLTADMQQWKRTIWMRNRAIVQLLFSSGMRVGELCSLRVGDLEDQGAWVTGKGDKRRFVRFGGTAWDRLQSYLKYRGNTNKTHPLLQRHDTACGDKILPLSVLSVQRIVSHLADDAGIKRKFTPHAFRHFFASTFLAQTHDLALTQDALGHADPRTTRVYAKTSKAQIEEAHGKIFG